MTVNNRQKAIETSARIEPCLFEENVPRLLADLAVDIQREAGLVGGGLSSHALAELAELVRIMNCYYSNLIEGHDIKPRDIERALNDEKFVSERRPLAQEAKAHVEVQRAIDIAHGEGKRPIPTSVQFLTWVHKSFYDEMSPEFRQARTDGRVATNIPGEFRTEEGEDITIGRHVSPSSAQMQNFMTCFETRFAAAETGGSNRIIAIATAHHRFNYIHPFVDGNGRVSRLMSHAMALRAGIGAFGLWSISRGLARGLKDRGEYKRYMDLADSPRRGDLDGKGNLSQAALVEYCEWFLTVMLDQIRFSKAAFGLDGLQERYKNLLRDLNFDKRAVDLMEAVFRLGAMERGQAQQVLKTSERTSRNVLSGLVKGGFLKSNAPKTPVRIGFPLEYRERLFPNLFGDEPIIGLEPPALYYGRSR
jgi:Fic family protein